MERYLPQAKASRAMLLVPALLLTLSAAAPAQTRIELQNNRFSPEQDVQLGQEAARDVRQQLPALNDSRTDAFVRRIGERLIENIPGDYRQPAFRYSFDVLNLRDINAFALPGGPMFLNRGMIQAARTEGEVAGVMAHELAHVVLRHGTVQATRGQKFQLGAIAGQILGAVVGGTAGSAIAQGSEFGLGAYFLKYSREFEREADLFGAQIMAGAGYDPREMASMFQTIERQGGRSGPEWLSSHPNPGNRAQAITREAEMLRVARSAPAGDIGPVHARLRQMPQAPTTEQALKARQGQGSREVAGTSGRGARVEPPASRWRTHQPSDFLRISVPENWRPIEIGGSVRYAPDGAHVRGQDGQAAFTHGVEVGVARTGGGNLQQQTEQLLEGFARSNPNLRRQQGYARTTLGGREGLTTTLSNVSEVTGQRESVNVSTVRLQDGTLLFLVGVAPAHEARAYADAFGRVRRSVQISDDRR
jgi:beta-barrel assembly-enhancing protease